MIKLLLLSKYLIILIIGFGFCFNGKSQNLIRNGSFENISPPNNWNNFGGEFITASQTPIHRILFDWDEFNSADLLPSACTHTYSGVPVNRYGQCYAKEGNNYVGFEPFYNNNETKEYIYQQLTSPLQAGNIYCLSFFVSRSDRVSYAIKSIGAYFSVSTPTLFSSYYVNATPQVLNQNGFITDTTQWIQVQGCFTAIGGEKFITIGNFNSNANTDTLYAGTNNPMYGIPNPDFAYYYIDDIQLWDALTTGIEDLNGSAINVYPNPAKDQINFKFTTGTTIIRRIELYDALGSLILTQDVAKKDNIINIQSLPNGIYYYLIITDNKTIKNDKIVVIKYPNN